MSLFAETSQVDYLHELRQMTPEQALDYVERLAHPDEAGDISSDLFVFDHNFLFFILRELYKVRPCETSELMKHFLAKLSRAPYSHLARILGEQNYLNLEIIRSFLESDNRRINLTGFLALEYALNKVVDGHTVNVDEEIKTKILELLKDIMTWKDPVLSAMATVTYIEATNPSEQEEVKWGTRVKVRFVKGVVEKLGPLMTRNYLIATDSGTEDYYMILHWVLYRVIQNTKPEKLREVFRGIGKEDETSLRVCNFIYNQVRVSPTGALDIVYKFGLKSEENEVRNPSIDMAAIIGRLVPDKVLEIYEKLLPLPEYQDYRARMTLTHAFGIYLECSQGKRARKNLEMLMNDKDRQVAMLADIVLNGIQFREEVP